MLFIKFIDNLFYLRVTNICVHTFVINKKIISVHIWKNSLFCCNRRYFRYTVIGNFQTAKSSLFLLRLSNPLLFLYFNPSFKKSMLFSNVNSYIIYLPILCYFLIYQMLTSKYTASLYRKNFLDKKPAFQDIIYMTFFIFIFLLYHNYSISSISSRSSPNNFNADSIGSFAAISTLQRRSKSIGFMELPPLKNLK